MQTFWILLGAATIATGVLDILSATFGVGGGFLARRVAAACWVVAVKLAGVLPKRLSRMVFRSFATLVNILLLIVWIGTLALGWWLVFGTPGAVGVRPSAGPVDDVGVLQFTVSTLSGLGRGIWTPGSDHTWQVIAVVASLMGTFVISFGISFLIPIIQAAASRRTLAHKIHTLGATPGAILEAYTGGPENQGVIEALLTAILASLIDCYQQHRTYPVLHFVHSDNRRDSLAINLAVLDEALTLMYQGLEPRQRPPEQLAGPLRQVLEEFLQALEGVYYLKSRGEKLEGLSKADVVLADAQVPGFDVEAYQRASQSPALRRRRKDIGTMLRNAGWTWNDVYERELPDDTKPLKLSLSS